MTATNKLKPNLREQLKEQLLERRSSCTASNPAQYSSPVEPPAHLGLHPYTWLSMLPYLPSNQCVFLELLFYIFLELHGCFHEFTCFLRFLFQSQRMLYILELHCAFLISPIIEQRG
jgi:hypothetical protein